MHTVLELAQFISSIPDINKNDRKIANCFQDYVKSNIVYDALCEDFGNIDFLKYHAFLALNKSHKAVYMHCVAMRRLMSQALSMGYKFKTNPSYFDVPPKPAPSHFEPLNKEQLDKLTEFLVREIDAIIKKEEIFQKALCEGKKITEKGCNFNKKNGFKPAVSFYSWQKSLSDCVFQLHSEAPRYPQNATLEQIQVNGEFGRLKKIDYDRMNTPFRLIYKRMGIQNLTSSKPFLYNAPEMSFIDVIGIIYPRIFEIYVITWAICLETGWSKEMVERINYDDYLYSPIPLESDVVFIKTTKERGIDGESDVSESKEYIHPSSKSNQKSAYNLIRLFAQRSSRLRTGLHYQSAIEEIGKEPFFIYFNESPGLPILFIHPDKHNEHVANTKNRFLLNNIGFKFDVRQLRPTCLYKREKEQNVPMVLQVALFGHSSSAITDEFYKNSSEFQQLRKDRLATELNAIEASIKDGSFRGSLSPLKQKKRIEDKIITIFSEHSNQSPIATCGNNKRPDWDGYEQQLKISGECKRFDKCLLCSQSTVFSDNIPFVVDRYLYLEKQKRTLRQDTFERLYADEYLATKEVVESWPYPDEIEEAEERTLINGYLLPPIFMEANL